MESGFPDRLIGSEIHGFNFLRGTKFLFNFDLILLFFFCMCFSVLFLSKLGISSLGMA
jgi:hypothetical protein